MERTRSRIRVSIALKTRRGLFYYAQLTETAGPTRPAGKPRKNGQLIVDAMGISDR
jgi:hypothetical protein